MRTLGLAGAVVALLASPAAADPGEVEVDTGQPFDCVGPWTGTLHEHAGPVSVTVTYCAPPSAAVADPGPILGPCTCDPVTRA